MSKGAGGVSQKMTIADKGGVGVSRALNRFFLGHPIISIMEGNGFI